MPISVHYFSSSRSMPVFILVGKVVLLICIKSALIMSLPTRTINKTSLNSFCRASYSAAHVGFFRNGTTIKFGFFLLENRFEVRIYGKGNFELVLSTVESHKRILFRHVYPNRFIVYTIFRVFVSGCLAVQSLKAVQAKVLSVPIATIATSK